jgi:hypothetical protein
MVGERKSDQLDGWLQQAAASPLQELHRFALGLRAEYGAMRAALPWTLEYRTGRRADYQTQVSQTPDVWAREDRFAASTCVTRGLMISLEKIPKATFWQRRGFDIALWLFSVLKRMSRWQNRSFRVCGNGSKMGSVLSSFLASSKVWKSPDDGKQYTWCA